MNILGAHCCSIIEFANYVILGPNSRARGAEFATAVTGRMKKVAAKAFLTHFIF